MCSAEVQTLCFVSPLCEDFDFAVIVLELDCTVEWVISTDHRPWVSLQFLSQIIAALFAFLVCIDYYCEVTRGKVACAAAASYPGLAEEEAKLEAPALGRTKVHPKLFLIKFTGLKLNSVEAQLGKNKHRKKP